jgi:hypothetical protein
VFRTKNIPDFFVAEHYCFSKQKKVVSGGLWISPPGLGCAGFFRRLKVHLGPMIRVVVPLLLKDSIVEAFIQLIYFIKTIGVFSACTR